MRLLVKQQQQQRGGVQVSSGHQKLTAPCFVNINKQSLRLLVTRSPVSHPTANIGPSTSTLEDFHPKLNSMNSSAGVSKLYGFDESFEVLLFFKLNSLATVCASYGRG